MNEMMNNIEKEMNQLLQRLFPINRSITGSGVRETLKILQEVVPLKMTEFSSGEDVFDWTIPNEWFIRDAYIKDSKGNKIIDFNKTNLCVMNYSQGISKTMSYQELLPHLYTLPSLPDAIPYRTTYYNQNWGFCVSYKQFQQFNEEANYEVLIDAEHKPGSLTIGEYYIQGNSKIEYLISTYICHPSLANDNLSGPILTAFLARELSKKRTRHSYRFVFVPETIGAIAYCAKNESKIKKIDSGFVVTCVGGPGNFSYKQSYNPNHYLNKLIVKIFNEQKLEYIEYPFNIFGSDERQYSSPGIGLNIVSIHKDKYQEYLYYHTSLDNLEFVKAKYIYETFAIYVRVIDLLEKNVKYRTTQNKCEVMLSKRDLYPKTGGMLFQSVSAQPDEFNEVKAIQWLLFYCDGKQTLLDIAIKINMDIEYLYVVAEKIKEKGLLIQVK